MSEREIRRCRSRYRFYYCVSAVSLCPLVVAALCWLLGPFLVGPRASVVISLVLLQIGSWFLLTGMAVLVLSWRYIGVGQRDPNKCSGSWIVVVTLTAVLLCYYAMLSLGIGSYTGEYREEIRAEYLCWRLEKIPAYKRGGTNEEKALRALLGSPDWECRHNVEVMLARLGLVVHESENNYTK